MNLGYELVDVRFLTEHGRPTLCLLVDREGGITVGDCQRISREIETLLEVEEVVRQRYFLEISSPGLDRPLVRRVDFIKYVGRQAEVKTREPIDGRRNYKGLLKAFEGDEVVMVIDGKDYRIPFQLIQKAQLVF